ncbi:MULTISPECIES: DUF5675 family protein [Bacteria]|uniref:DUF5675 domain-containing protein n=1 Tax=Mucispirillum schaedleri ASF457 TaxID=1379858 RepID=A0AA97LRB7_9BACT|nr:MULTISPECIES: DUF5675 family protein [Bacteria]USF25062.1 hypothetical protein N508_002157 [Mucispirillum schaedleri ASF457]
MSEKSENYELQFVIKDHMTNEPITSATIQLYSKEDSSFKKEITISTVEGTGTISIEAKDARKKLYIKLLNNDNYYSTPYPDEHLPTYAICYRRGKIQQVRFLPKSVIVGVLKAYGKPITSLFSSESEYLSNSSFETITISKEQTITLKAFLISNKTSSGKVNNNKRYFLNNSVTEEQISESIHWAFSITNKVSGFSKNSPVDIESLSSNGVFNSIEEINDNTNIYKLMKSGEEITGHTINFTLSDIMSESLLRYNELFDNYYIVFYAYALLDDAKEAVLYYNSYTDGLPLIELKLVLNKYSMLFDGYNLELYENGKYIDGYDARLTNNGALVKDIFSVSNSVNVYGLDNLYRCEAKLVSKMVDNELRRVLYLRAYSTSNESNDEAADFIVDNINLIDLENQLNTKKSKENIYNKVIHISSIDYIKLWHKIQFQNDILVKFMYQPRYVIEVTRYKEVYNDDLLDNYIKKRFGATYGVFAVYVYINGEKFLFDSIIDVYNNYAVHHNEQIDAYNEEIMKKYPQDYTSKLKPNSLKKTVIKDKKVSKSIIGIIEDYIKDMSNHVFIKSDMRKKNLQDNNSYALLTYGGYTMEPSGPDTITEEVKRRIPEGHYKGIFHYSEPPYKKNTLNLYNDTVHSSRYILLHAGGRYIEFTTGCVLISRESYETGNNYTSKDLRGDIEYETPTMNILKSLDILYTAIYEHHVSNGQNLHYETDLSKYISCVIRNKINRG